MAAKSCRKIDVLITADRILGALQNSESPLSVSELARVTGFSVDTVFRQVGTMEDLRWAERIGEGYTLGLRLAVLLAKCRALAEGKIKRAQRDLSELTGGCDDN
jgi:DNA-binding IclR family transcriptional regulator